MLFIYQDINYLAYNSAYDILINCEHDPKVGWRRREIGSQTPLFVRKEVDAT